MGTQGGAGLGRPMQAPPLHSQTGRHPYTSQWLSFRTPPEARLPAAGSASVRTAKSMTREVKSKAVCWPLWITEMQWRSP